MENIAEQNWNPKAKEESTAVCLVCGTASKVFFEMQKVPVCCNILWPTRAAALASEQAEIHLAFCPACGYIFNALFDPARLTYDAHYDNSLHFSPRFQEYAEGLARHLVERYALYRKTVIEIGCGNGEFLNLLCEDGSNRGIGFDPSFIPGRANLKAGKGIEIIADTYSERYADLPCDLLCGRHVLEHAANPCAMIGAVRRAVEKNPRAAVYFEVPNILFTLRHNGVWDIIYEHVSYFAPQSLYRLFTDAGFHVLEIRESFGGQYLSLEALVSNDNGDGYHPVPDDTARLAADVDAFSAYRKGLVDRWLAQFDEMRHRGQRVVVWGAGAKGTIFLNILHEHPLVEYLVDINPHKQGKFVPGTGQQIVPPEALRELKPDALILMNPIYRNEVERIVAELGISPQFFTA